MSVANSATPKLDTAGKKRARLKLTGLWRDADFLKLWTGTTISMLGTQITTLALPLAAVLNLQATPAQMGLLRATHSGMALLAGFFAGVWIDRLRRRPILIGTDLAFAVLAGSIPLAAFLGVLRIEQLYIVVFFTGILTIFSDVASMSYVPSLVGREQLVEANSKLQTTNSVAVIAGPSLGGVLVQSLTAPIAITFDAVSFVISALFLWRIRAPEPPLAPAAERRSVWAEIGEGLRFVYGNPVLRPLAETIAAHFFFVSMISAMFILYATRELRIESLLLGLIFASLGPGFLLGALAASRVPKRFGLGRAMIGATLVNALAALLIPLAGGSIAVAVSLVAVAHFLIAFGIQLYGINMVSLRQTMTPNQLQGRMNASFKTINLGAAALGALAAGALGEAIGLRATLVVGSFGLFTPFLRLFFSPVRQLRDQPH
jgi:predicted MFS family arabinose efflux permease